MKKEKQQLFCLSNKQRLTFQKGQIIFVIATLTLILFIFLVIILGNLSSTSLQFGYVFRNFVSLRSVAISGLRYALYQINQNPNFTTSSAVVFMPQGYFNYTVLDVASGTKKIRVQATLTTGLSRILNATATIDSSGKILDIEMSEE